MALARPDPALFGPALAGPGPGPAEVGPDLEGQGQGQQNWLRAGPARTVRRGQSNQVRKVSAVRPDHEGNYDLL